MSAELRIATRRSRLALWQAEHVRAALMAAHPGLVVTLLPIVTEGDRILDRSLAAIGGKGLFIKELEVAMQEGRADIAVHSMKDMPAELPPGMVISTVLERADPRDAFLSPGAGNLAGLGAGARVGTSSLRRQCQLLQARPDLRILPLRGNVETRLRKLDEGEYHAIILATAGLERLGLGGRITQRIDPAVMLPAVGQGIVGIECREDDARTRELLAPLEHAEARRCINAERSFSARLGGSCQSPIAAFARLVGGQLQLRGLVGAPDGSAACSDSITGGADDGAALGRSLAERLLAAGADRLLAASRHAGAH